MKIKEMTTQHLANRINFFIRTLKEAPSEQHYMGNSFAAEQAVESMNNHNEILIRDISKHIKKLQKELQIRYGN